MKDLKDFFRIFGWELLLMAILLAIAVIIFSFNY